MIIPSTYTKPVGFADQLIDLLYDEDIWRQTKGFAGAEYYAHRRSALQIGQLKSNRFADLPAIYEHRRKVMPNDDCRMCRSTGYRQLAIP